MRERWALELAAIGAVMVDWADKAIELASESNFSIGGTNYAYKQEARHE